MAKSTENLSRQMGKSFADVLLEDGADPKTATVVEKELRAAATSFPLDAVTFFQNPVFDFSEKEAVLEKMAASMGWSDPTRRFLGVLISQGLLKHLETIAASYADNLRAKRNEVHADVRTAFKLAPQEEEKIRKALERRTGKKVSFDVHVDPELIGGVVANVGGVVYDASIRGYLDRMQEELAS